MTNEPSLGEVARRLERMETRIEEVFRELSLRVVDRELYGRDQRETERRFTEIERDLLEVREASKEAVRELAARMDKEKREVEARMDKGGANWRQAVYSGLVPGLLLLVSVAVQLALSLKGGK